MEVNGGIDGDAVVLNKRERKDSGVGGVGGASNDDSNDDVNDDDSSIIAVVACLVPTLLLGGHSGHGRNDSDNGGIFRMVEMKEDRARMKVLLKQLVV